MQSVKRKVFPDTLIKSLGIPLKRESLSFAFCILSFTFYAFSFTLLSGCYNIPLYKETRVMMGTFVEVTSPDKEAVKTAFSEIKRIEGLLNKYDANSEVSQLNQNGKLEVSPETFYIIKVAKEFWRLSNGAFDITAAPLVDLWGFTQKKYHIPTEEELKKSLAAVGSEKIILHTENNVVEFTFPDTKIDLGAIAKGFALDCAIKKLRAAQIKSCLINAGGDIYCLGEKSPGKCWKVAIKDPQGNKKEYLGYLELKDRAVATSGNYEQFFMQGKKRYSHIFNPKTGYPADAGINSVTVTAQDCLTADALATAIFVLGKERGEELIKRFKRVEARIY